MKGPLTRERMARLCHFAGASLVRAETLEGLGDRVAYEVRCPSHASKLLLLDGIAWICARCDPRVRALSMAIAGQAKGLDRARAIHAAVQAHVPYVGELRETFQDALTTWEEGGDCDDHTALVLSLGRAGGLRGELDTLPFAHAPAVPRHVWGKLGELRGPLWHAETTVAAMFGEHPQAAKKRLRLGERKDLAG